LLVHTKFSPIKHAKSTLNKHTQFKSQGIKMGTTRITTPLSASEVQTLRTQTTQIGASSTPTIRPNQFVFFAAFDGTNNIRTNPAIAGDTQTTNVGQMWGQYESGRGSNRNAGGNYYPGPGTPGTRLGSSVLSGEVTGNIRETAEKAYRDFSLEAQRWLAADPSRSPSDITTAITGFSRGSTIAVVFSQMVAERGLRVGNTVVATAAQVGIAGMYLSDPVSDGYAYSVAIPDKVNANNIVVTRAQNEYRKYFEADDYSYDPRVQTFVLRGNHGDMGSFYDNGISALTLDASTKFFQGLNVPMANVPVSRQFRADQPVVVHDEGSNNWYWPESSKTEARGTRRIDPPVLANNPLVLERTEANNFDGTSTRRTTFRNGTVVEQLLDGDGRSALTANPGETLVRDAITGTYRISNGATGEVRSYNPTTQETRFSQPDKATITIDKNGAIKSLVPPSNLRSSIEVEGELWAEAGNGQLYRFNETGELIVRDSIANNGIVYAVNADSSLTPVATFDTNYSLGGQETLTKDLNGNLLETRQVSYSENQIVVTTTTAGEPEPSSVNLYARGQTRDNSIEDTPDGQGGINRTFLVSVNGQQLALSQYVSAADLDAGGFDWTTGWGDNNIPMDLFTTQSIRINNQILVASSNIDSADLAAYGFTWANITTGSLPEPASALLAGLDPANATVSGWIPPQVIETSLAGGITQRSLDLGNGIILSNDRQAAGNGTGDDIVISARMQWSSAASSGTASYDASGQETHRHEQYSIELGSGLWQVTTRDFDFNGFNVADSLGNGSGGNANPAQLRVRSEIYQADTSANAAPGSLINTGQSTEIVFTANAANNGGGSGANGGDTSGDWRVSDVLQLGGQSLDGAIGGAGISSARYQEAVNNLNLAGLQPEDASAGVSAGQSTSALASGSSGFGSPSHIRNASALYNLITGFQNAPRRTIVATALNAIASNYRNDANLGTSVATTTQALFAIDQIINGQTPLAQGLGVLNLVSTFNPQNTTLAGAGQVGGALSSLIGLQGESQQGKLNTTKKIACCAGNTPGRGLKGCKNTQKSSVNRSNKRITIKSRARCAGSMPGRVLKGLKNTFCVTLNRPNFQITR
jgi:hypothetical protein